MANAGTDWKENVPEGEQAQFERLAETLRSLQHARTKSEVPDRGLHAKAHGGFTARFEVSKDLPEALSVGAFATPGSTYEAFVRFSNGGGARARRRAWARRRAVRRSWEEGDPGMEDAKTQDFLMIPKHDATSEQARAIAARVEKLSFDPWHAQVEHRPLGAIMRARNVAYRVSTKERSASPEPEGTEAK